MPAISSPVASAGKLTEKTDVKPETKLAIRRWTIRKLRLWFDAFHEWADARIHAAEVQLRDELSAQNSPAASFHGLPVRAKELPRTSCAAGETFEQWEMRRSGVAPISKKSARRRGIPASAFDLRFSTR